MKNKWLLQNPILLFVQSKLLVELAVMIKITVTFIALDES